MGISRENLADIFRFAGIGVGTVGNIFAPGIGAAAGAALGQAAGAIDSKPKDAEAKAAKVKREDDERMVKHWLDYAKKLKKKKEPAYPGEQKAAMLDALIGGDLALREGKPPGAQFLDERRMYIQTLRQMIATMATIEEAD
jgi:hypothetical protein